MNYKNQTANLLRLSLPFYYWQSHLPYGSAYGLLSIQFACLVLQPRLKLVNIDLWIMFEQGESLLRRKIICIHNKLIKSQSSHKATHFRGQLFQLPAWYLSFLWLSLWRIAYGSSFVFVQSKRRLLHKRFARKKCFCMLCDSKTDHVFST